jgi:uncharacterized RDD family membrane protein YckC
MNTNFISDNEIDRVLGRIGEYKGPSESDRPFDRFNMSEEDKSRLRAEYARKKSQQYAVNPGLVYSEDKEFKKTTQVFSNTSHGAGVIRRTYAFCTDLCIVGLALIAFVYASISFFGAEHFSQVRLYSSASTNIVVWLGALYAVLFVLYLVYFEGTMGQTPGKMFLNVKIVDEKNQKPSFGIAFLRTLLFLVPPIGLLGVHNFLTRTRLVNVG